MSVRGEHSRSRAAAFTPRGVRGSALGWLAIACGVAACHPARTSVAPRAQARARAERYREIDTRLARLPAQQRAAMRRRLTTAFDEVRRAYAGRDEREFERATLRLLALGSRQPIDQLAMFHDDIVARVETDGTGPHLSFVIDYLGRLGSIRLASLQRKHESLARAIHTRRSERESTRRVYVRSADRRSFDRYPASVGRALVALEVLPAARDSWLPIARGSGGLLPLLAMLESCLLRNDSSDAGELPDDVAAVMSRDVCDLLLDDVPATGAGRDVRSRVGSLSRGRVASTGSCLDALGDDTFAQATRRLEDYMACRANGPTPNNPGASIMQGISQRWSSHEVFFGPALDEDGHSGTTWTVDEGDGTTTTLRHVEVAWQDEEGNVVATASKYSQTRTDAGGNIISQHEEAVVTHANGETSSASYDYQKDPETGSSSETVSAGFDGADGGASYTSTVFTDAAGNQTGTRTTVTVEYADGSTESWTTTTDANGNTTTEHTTTPASTSPGADEEETATLPPGEEAAIDHCAALLHEVPPDAPAQDALAPVINPDPDDFGASPIPAACVPANDTPSPSTHCTSVWLCLDGTQVDASCRCVSGTGGAPPPAGIEMCQQILCADGACNPLTGTCGGSEGGYSPPLGSVTRPLGSGPTTALPGLESTLQGRIVADPLRALIGRDEPTSSRPGTLRP